MFVAHWVVHQHPLAFSTSGLRERHTEKPIKQENCYASIHFLPSMVKDCHCYSSLGNTILQLTEHQCALGGQCTMRNGVRTTVDVQEAPFLTVFLVSYQLGHGQSQFETLTLK